MGTTPPQQLSFLQRAIIQRLSDAGYGLLANCAREAWSRGRACTLLPGEVTEPELVADYEKANAEVQRSQHS
jgi:hypothetical protein